MKKFTGGKKIDILPIVLLSFFALTIFLISESLQKGTQDIRSRAYGNQKPNLSPPPTNTKNTNPTTCSGVCLPNGEDCFKRESVSCTQPNTFCCAIIDNPNNTKPSPSPKPSDSASCNGCWVGESNTCVPYGPTTGGRFCCPAGGGISKYNYPHFEPVACDQTKLSDPPDVACMKGNGCWVPDVSQCVPYHTENSGFCCMGTAQGFKAGGCTLSNLNTGLACSVEGQLLCVPDATQKQLKCVNGTWTDTGKTCVSGTTKIPSWVCDSFKKQCVQTDCIFGSSSGCYALNDKSVCDVDCAKGTATIDLFSGTNCNNNAGVCVSGSYTCDKFPLGQLDCPPSEICVPETAHCQIPSTQTLSNTSNSSYGTCPPDGKYTVCHTDPTGLGFCPGSSSKLNDLSCDGGKTLVNQIYCCEPNQQNPPAETISKTLAGALTGVGASSAKNIFSSNPNQPTPLTSNDIKDIQSYQKAGWNVVVRVSSINSQTPTVLTVQGVDQNGNLVVYGAGGSQNILPANTSYYEVVIFKN